jgi:hypothetical protein
MARVCRAGKVDFAPGRERERSASSCGIRTEIYKGTDEGESSSSRRRFVTKSDSTASGGTHEKGCVACSGCFKERNEAKIAWLAESRKRGRARRRASVEMNSARALLAARRFDLKDCLVARRRRIGEVYCSSVGKSLEILPSPGVVGNSNGAYGQHGGWRRNGNRKSARARREDDAVDLSCSGNPNRTYA